MVLIPGSGTSPGGGHGNPLQYSCLENSTDRAAWRATVHGITESDRTEATEHTDTHTHTHTHSLLTSSGKSIIAVTLTAGRQAISNNFQVVILPFDIQEGLGESPWAGHVWGWQPLYGGDLLKQEEWKPLQEESKPLQEESYRAALGLPRNDRGIWSTRQTTIQSDLTISASGPQVACQYLPVHHPKQINEFLLLTMWKASLVHHPFSD